MTTLARVDLPAGPIEYGDTGGPGPVLVLIGGLAMDGSLWDSVIAEMGEGVRCITPTLPLGSHRIAMRPDADLSLRGLARIVADFLEALGLHDVTLCFSDWNGAPVMIAEDWTERVGRLVLTPCEAFENYPPGLAGLAASISAKLPGGLVVMRGVLASPRLRQLPFVYGKMSRHGVPEATMRRWLEPLRRPEIRRDLAKYAGDFRAGRATMRLASRALGEFERPVLIVWSRDGRMMPPEHGRRFATAFPCARLAELDDCDTLMPIDQPATLAKELCAFIGIP
jgi:pimeloyl-ACP methyl ester carboxylesterase